MVILEFDLIRYFCKRTDHLAYKVYMTGGCLSYGLDYIDYFSYLQFAYTGSDEIKA